MGTQKLPAACIFPARRVILEKLSGKTFPNIACPDLEEWLEGIGAKEVSLVFAGAYSGNPASILGHTFLRFYGSNDRQLGQSLLSYSVGFLATPDPGDSRALYILKGLTGGYPGYYNIEAHYIKVGLYNNSESRDLWEWPLNLDSDEVTLLVKHIWELTFNARFRYYFIDENCSYRILTAINVIRPGSAFKENMGLVVIPSETVHLAKQQKTLTGEVLYRPSIERKISMNLSLLDQGELKQFRRACQDLEVVRQIKNPVVLDALIDYWIHTKLKRREELSRKEKDLAEEAHKQRASLEVKSPEAFTNEQIRERYGLEPILDGHRDSLFSFVGDFDKAYRLTLSSGIQPAWMSSRGYDNIHQIEYLGASYEQKAISSFEGSAKDRWELLLIRAKALSAANSTQPKWSWGFDSSLRNQCLVCENYTSQPQIKLSGQWGGAFVWKRLSLYVLPEIQILSWQSEDINFAVPIGVESGVTFESGQFKFLGELGHRWWKQNQHSHLKLNINYLLSQNVSARWQLAQDWLNKKQGRSINLFGGAYFF